VIILLTALLNGKKIMATDPNWDDRKAEYRVLCNEQAVCPICQERIICRFGEIRQHYFAHRHNSDCPGDHDTEEHMTGKAILYVFFASENSSLLQNKFPRHQWGILCN